VLWGAVGIYQITTAWLERSRAEATAAVFEHAGAPVVEPKEGEEAPPAKGLHYASDQARADAVVKANAGGDDKAAALVGVVVGGAQATLGKWAVLLQSVDTALAKANGQALELPLREQRATALEGLGKIPEAVAEWQKVGQLATAPFTRALANVRVGDLQNPALGSKAPDPAKAKSAYEAALKLVRVGDKDPPAGDLAMIAADVQLKLRRL
jgi:hypothetical protein